MLNYTPMELMMYLCNDLIDSVPLNVKKITFPGYLGNIKRKLEKKYISLITQSDIEPEFLVVNISQKENSSSKPAKPRN